MTYLPLARKYRPSSFEELVGQEAVAKALGNAIKLGREPHGLILSGVRGIGKTTTARLYAKALNCDEGPTPTPCNVCPSCKAIGSGFHEDVIEIDGASNTGVADVRALQETVEYVPQRSKFKVYIIDEVHMLSQAAFNALLKTLEEPPAHVVFVFATTELHKVPQTIISRCQTFYLQKHTLQNIRERLAQILKAEDIQFEDAAVAMVARAGQGSMRDALTLLDQAIALGEGQVTVAALEPLLSGSQAGTYLELLEALVQREAAAVLAAIDKFDQAGVEYPELITALATITRHGFVLRDLGMQAIDRALLGLDDAELGRLQEIAQQAPDFDLNRIFRSLVQCQTELDGSELDRFVVENYCLEWCMDPGLPDLSQLATMSPGDIGGRQGAVAGQPSGAPGSASGGVTAAAKPAAGRAPNFAALRQELKAQQKPGAKAAQPMATAAPHPAAAVKPAAPAPVAPAPEPMAAPSPTPAEIPVAAPTPAAEPLAAPPPAPEPVQTPAPPPAPEMATQAAVEPEPKPSPEPAAPTSEAAMEDLWPADWRQMVDTWKQRKPLQARKLEEIHPVHYSRERLDLVVPEGSYAAQALLAPDEQRKLAEEFRELFGFTGKIVLKAADVETVTEQEQVEELPDTILTEKAREREEEKARLATQAVSEPLTKEMLEVLGGKIEDVKVFGESVNTTSSV